MARHTFDASIYYFPFFTFSIFSTDEYSATAYLTSNGLTIKKLANTPKVLSDLEINVGVAMPCCAWAFPGMEVGIQVLAGQAPSSQIAGSLL